MFCPRDHKWNDLLIVKFHRCFNQRYFRPYNRGRNLHLVYNSSPTSPNMFLLKCLTEKTEIENSASTLISGGSTLAVLGSIKNNTWIADSIPILFSCKRYCRFSKVLVRYYVIIPQCFLCTNKWLLCSRSFKRVSQKDSQNSLKLTCDTIKWEISVTTAVISQL